MFLDCHDCDFQGYLYYLFCLCTFVKVGEILSKISKLFPSYFVYRKTDVKPFFSYSLFAEKYIGSR